MNATEKKKNERNRAPLVVHNPRAENEIKQRENAELKPRGTRDKLVQ